MAAVKKANTLLIGTVQDICRAFYECINKLQNVINLSPEELEKSINNAFVVFTSTKINFNKDNKCKLFCPHIGDYMVFTPSIKIDNNCIIKIEARLTFDNVCKKIIINNLKFI